MLCGVGKPSQTFFSLVDLEQKKWATKCSHADEAWVYGGCENNRPRVKGRGERLSREAEKVLGQKGTIQTPAGINF